LFSENHHVPFHSYTKKSDLYLFKIVLFYLHYIFSPRRLLTAFLCVFCIGVASAQLKIRQQDSVILQPMPDETPPNRATFFRTNVGMSIYLPMTGGENVFQEKPIQNISFTVETQQFYRHRIQFFFDHEILSNRRTENNTITSVTYSSSVKQNEKDKFFLLRGGYSYMYHEKLAVKKVYRNPFSINRRRQGAVNVMLHKNRQGFLYVQYSRLQQTRIVGLDSVLTKEITGVAPPIEGENLLPIKVNVLLPSVIIGHSWSKIWNTYFYDNGKRVDRSRNLKLYMALSFSPEPPTPDFIYKLADGKEPEQVEIDPNHQLNLFQFFESQTIGGFVGFEAWRLFSSPLSFNCEMGVRPGLGGNVSTGFDRILDYSYLHFKASYRLDQVWKSRGNVQTIL
jgi:hypothetical protein